MRNYIQSTGVFVLALTIGACDVFSPGDKLTDAEVGELAAEIAQLALVSSAIPSAQPAPAEEAVRITITLNQTNSCEGGGSAAISGSATADVNEQTGAGTISLNYTVTPTNCAVRTASAKVFRLTGDPNLTVSGQFSFTQTSLDGTLDYQGRFKWVSDDGRSGSCDLSMKAVYDVTMSQTSMSGSVSVTGKVCGRDVNRTVTITASA